MYGRLSYRQFRFLLKINASPVGSSLTASACHQPLEQFVQGRPMQHQWTRSKDVWREGVGANRL